jgi:hypothetical protein
MTHHNQDFERHEAFGVKEFKNNSNNNKRRTCHEKNMFYISNGGGCRSANYQRACARVENGQPHRIICQAVVCVQDLPQG